MRAEHVTSSQLAIELLLAENYKYKLSCQDLDKPTKAPLQGREHEFATFGRSFLTLAVHQAMHRSHLTDALRAVGRRAA
jgi:hypothetical protein